MLLFLIKTRGIDYHGYREWDPLYEKILTSNCDKEYCDFFREYCLNEDNRKRIDIYPLLKLPNIDFVKYLIDDIDKTRILPKLAISGKLDMMKFIYSHNSLDNPIDIHYNYECNFCISCVNGYIDVAKWLYGLYEEGLEEKQIDIHVKNDTIFIRTAIRGSLNSLQFLHEKDTLDDWNGVFIICCRNGNLENAKWIYSLGNIDLRTDDDFIFKWCCFNNNQEFVQWLSTLDPLYNYNIVDGQIVGLSINIDINDMINQTLYHNSYNIEKSIDLIKKHVPKIALPNESFTCSICLDEHEQVLKLPCNHKYCIDGICVWNISNNVYKHKCLCCQEEYDWTDCRLIN